LQGVGLSGYAGLLLLGGCLLQWNQQQYHHQQGSLGIHACPATGDEVSSKLDSLKQAAENAAADVQSSSANVAGSVKDAVAAAGSTAADLVSLASPCASGLCLAAVAMFHRCLSSPQRIGQHTHLPLAHVQPGVTAQIAHNIAHMCAAAGQALSSQGTATLCQCSMFTHMPPPLSFMQGALTKEAVLQLAKDAASAVDGLVSDLSTSIAAAKRDASSSSKAASVAFDGLVASLIQKAQGVKDVLVHSNAEAAARVDTIIGSFASTATGLRKDASNRTLSWDVAFDRVSVC
jgi:hypothetical protein